MAVTYFDPWKERKFGELRGEKGDAFSRVYFEEASFYKTDNAYVLAGQFTNYTGIVRKFKPENKIDAGLCSVAIYGSDYTAREKNKSTGNYEEVTLKASVYEKTVYETIKSNENQFVGEDLAFKGWFDFLPDAQASLEPITIDLFDIHSTGYWKLTPIPASGKYPKWEDVSYNNNGKSGGKGYSGYAKTTPEDKLSFVKKELISSISDATFETESLAVILKKFKQENISDQSTYSDTLELLKAILK